MKAPVIAASSELDVVMVITNLGEETAGQDCVVTWNTRHSPREGAVEMAQAQPLAAGPAMTILHSFSQTRGKPL